MRSDGVIPTTTTTSGSGDGSPLVLLHGYVGDGPTTWRRQLDGLSDEFTVVPWDEPGSGRSSDPPDAVASPTTPTAWPNSSTGSAELSPSEFVGVLLPTMFSKDAPAEPR
jgi:pimeloyl-ACP methyl ester carboxylesterase